MVKEYRGIVYDVKLWKEGLKSIVLTLNERMEYTAGQYVLLKAVVDGRVINRAYSIASAPNGREIEIIFRVAGVFTNYLNNLKKGDEITVIGPFGNFTLGKAKTKKIVFIATGTGVSPLLSMLRYLYKNGMCKSFDKIVFMYGTRYKDMLVHLDEFEEYARRCENFEFVPILSREEGWSGRKGHVQNFLDEFLWQDADYFLCGLPAMTDEVEKLLLEKGIKKECVHTERY